MITDGNAIRSIEGYLADSKRRTRSAMEYDARNRARSRRNISEWRTYLPEDCVASMIGMGWDVTT